MTLLPGAAQLIETADGASLAVQRWDGSEPWVGFIHASGFNKEVWAPVIGALNDGGVDAAGWAVDQRGHGDSSAMPIPMDWAFVGSDIAQVIGAGRGTTIGVGHSSGGAALAMSAIADPDAFEHLVLIEPIITPPPYERHEDDPMAAVAEGRRSSFPDRETARTHFSSKGPFAGWVDDAMDAYLEGGLRDAGSEVVLKCAPATEAEHYRSGWAHPTWDRLGEIACPVTLVAGAESTTHHGTYLSELTRRFRQVEVRVVPRASHFVPMERPGLVAESILNARGAG